MTQVYQTPEEKNAMFLQKAERMKEAHVVSIEFCVDKFYINETFFRKKFNTNKKNFTLRIKFADFPCVELDAQHYSEYCSLVSLCGSSRKSDEMNKKLTVIADYGESDTQNGEPDSEMTNLEKKKIQLKDIEEAFENQAGEEESVKEVEGPPEEGKEEISSSSDEFVCTQDKKQIVPDKILSYKKVSIHFRSGKALIFAITPQRLLYDLVNKPLRVYIYYYEYERLAMQMGMASFYLFEISDVVPHMISIEGGARTQSSMGGLYPIFDASSVLQDEVEIGHLKIDVLITTHGVMSCSRLFLLDPPLFSKRYLFDEWVEDRDVQQHPNVERDVSSRPAIVTGHEHIPDIEEK